MGTSSARVNAITICSKSFKFHAERQLFNVKWFDDWQQQDPESFEGSGVARSAAHHIVLASRVLVSVSRGRALTHSAQNMMCVFCVQQS